MEPRGTGQMEPHGTWWNPRNPAVTAAVSRMSIALSIVAIALLTLWQAHLAQPIVVIDGDTVDRWPLRYRLAGFDAPETKRGRYRCHREMERGNAATARLGQLLDAADRVEIIRTSWKPDKWGRVLADIKIDGRSVRDIAISEGWGAPYTGRGPKRDWCAE